VIGLAGLGGGARVVDSSADPADAVGAALDLLAHATAVSASGPVDHAVGRVGKGSETRVVLVKVAGGSALLPRVTATGCALGALVAAYAAVAPDPFNGLVAAHTHFAVAAELAEAVASGPGSFAAAFIDALDAVDETALRQRGHIEAAVALD
jgi:hydroxyethylthiazole kinase